VIVANLSRQPQQANQELQIMAAETVQESAQCRELVGTARKRGEGDRKAGHVANPFPHRSTPLEELDFTFVFLRCCAGRERTEVPSFAGTRILLPGIQPVSARFELSDHGVRILAGNVNAMIVTAEAGNISSRWSQRRRA